MNNENIDQVFEMLNEEQKTNYLNEFNKNKKSLIILFSILIFLFVVTLPIALINYVADTPYEIAMLCVCFIFYIAIFLICLIFTIKQIKWSNEKKIKKQIEINLKRKSNEEKIEVKCEPTTEEINRIADLTNRLYFNFSSNNELCEIISNNLNINANILSIELFCTQYQKRTLSLKKYNSQHIAINSSSTTEFRLPTIELLPQTDYSVFVGKMKVVEEVNKFTLRRSFKELESIFTLLKRQSIIKTDITTDITVDWIENAEFTAFLFLFRCFKLKNLVKKVDFIKQNLNDLLSATEELSNEQATEVGELNLLVTGTTREIITALYNSELFEKDEILNWYLLIEYAKEPISTPYSNIFNSKRIEAMQVIQDLKDKEKVDRLKNGNYQNQYKYSISEIDNMDGYKFEHFVAEIFNKLGYKTEPTKLSGDQGVDVIAKKGDKIIAIQAKHYNQAVGNHAIMEVVAGAKIYNATLCYVVTNNYFTKSAKELANAHNVILWDRDKLIEKLSEI